MLKELLCSVAAAGGAFVLAAPFPRPDSHFEQPILFSHKTHVTAGLECVDCHSGSQTDVAARIPTLAQCLECHEEPAGESLEEPKVRDHAAAGSEIPFRPWTRIRRSLVLFSHRRHTGAAGLVCADCHGGMEHRVVPPDESTAPISMRWCVDCHREDSAPTDCLACHR